MTLTIQQATPGDTDLIIQIGRDTYLEHFSELWFDIDSFLDEDFTPASVDFCLRHPELHQYWLAFVDDEIAGFAKLNLNKLAAHQAFPGLEIQKIYIKKAFTNQQIGKHLVDQCIRVATLYEQPVIWLDVLKTNQRALQFYQRNGFDIIAEIPYHTDKMEIGMYVMARLMPY